MIFVTIIYTTWVEQKFIFDVTPTNYSNYFDFDFAYYRTKNHYHQLDILVTLSNLIYTENKNGIEARFLLKRVFLASSQKHFIDLAFKLC